MLGRRAFLGVAAAAATLAACSAPGTGSDSAAGPSSGATSAAGGGGTSGTQPGSTASASATPTGSATASGRPARPSLLDTAGPDIVHGPRSREEVALTFHGQGPASLTDRVLAHCRDAGAAITVFAVGTWLADDPSLGRAIVRGGHDLGNHTWSHQQMPSLDAATARQEVARGAAALKKAVGTTGWWFRPSGTPRSTATIRAAALASGYRRCISYDVDPEDYRDPGAALVRSRTRKQVRPGSIVSLHLGHPGTVEALPGILADLSHSGLRPVTLSTLLRD
ncbi:Peptidoglycan/xylan/chitin deacetylase, PgdA/CDA1 family [Pedococcus cremeus]|uniref:Peptidoglycan/xylan/chitin deacetylase, PgdA/CDA1 family n=1 Tax=Pedococcus cremeus TaxID=587636 RepID=A0A1H9X8M1_9MICO|nr:Peptidoglycan/xylan/chitin deacetylase, PgdA/CDA1 family [Pedococcus cremeus]